jgi:hypothetical protein
MVDAMAVTLDRTIDTYPKKNADVTGHVFVRTIVSATPSFISTASKLSSFGVPGYWDDCNLPGGRAYFY